MKMADAQKIIYGRDETKIPGFMVAFETIGGTKRDYFPDKLSGEPLILTEEKAWELANSFAAQTKGRYTNIYVVDSDYQTLLWVKKEFLISDEE